jgi:hypothetical protein
MDAGAEDPKPAAIERSHTDTPVLMDIDHAVPLHQGVSLWLPCIYSSTSATV